MTTERLLIVIGLVSAWARGDSEAVEVLIKGQDAQLFADLLDFTSMVLNQNTNGNAEMYLAHLSEQALGLQATERAT